MQRKNLQEHMTTACQWRVIECEHCSEPHPKFQMEVDMIQFREVHNPKKNHVLEPYKYIRTVGPWDHEKQNSVALNFFCII